MLQQLDQVLWVDEVPFKLLGINFGNRMTCIQLRDKSFWLHSPNKIDRTTYEAIKTKGKIKYLVAPSLMHNLFVMDWKKQHTGAQVIAPSQAKKLQVDIKLDETSEDNVAQLFNDEISCIPINGMPVVQEYAFIHHISKTLVLTDLAFNFGKDVTGWAKIFLKAYGAYDKFGPTLTIRTLIKDKKAFSVSLRKVALEDFDRIIVSHGRIVENDGKVIFNEAFEKYLKN